MKSLSIRMTVESPLTIRSDHAANGAAGVKCIPGSTFLGGLASLYRLLYTGEAEKAAFAQLFLQEQVSFPYLYPAIFDDEGLQDQGSPVYPLPITAATCKRHQGFLFPNDRKNDGHGARDTLFDWALFRLVSKHPELQEKVQRLEILRRGKNCHCSEALDRFEGYYRRNDLQPSQMILAQSYTRLQTHTGIDRASGTVQDGVLYNRQVFEEGMQFWGEVRTSEDDQLFERFTTFVEEVGSVGLLRMGTGRTRGMGKVSFAAKLPVVTQDRFTEFSQRLDSFNRAFQRRAADFKLEALPYAYFFALTLHSPLILCDDLLRYQSLIDAATLRAALAPGILPELTLLYYAASTRHVTGWQELWGTPRAGEYAIESGSVFFFACSSPPDAACLQALFALEEQGLGARRAEGFGRICFSDQFHQLVQQEAK